MSVWGKNSAKRAIQLGPKRDRRGRAEPLGLAELDAEC